jgi:hypothetical protein
MSGQFRIGSRHVRNATASIRDLINECNRSDRIAAGDPIADAFEVSRSLVGDDEPHAYSRSAIR